VTDAKTTGKSFSRRVLLTATVKRNSIAESMSIITAAPSETSETKSILQSDENPMRNNGLCMKKAVLS